MTKEVQRDFDIWDTSCYLLGWHSVPVSGCVAEGAVEGGLAGTTGGRIVGTLLRWSRLVLAIGRDAPQAPQAYGEPVVPSGWGTTLPVESALFKVGVHLDDRDPLLSLPLKVTVTWKLFAKLPSL